MQLVRIMYDLLITIISLDTFFWFKGWIAELKAQWQRCSRIEEAPQNHLSKLGHSRLPGAWCWRFLKCPPLHAVTSRGDPLSTVPICYCDCCSYHFESAAWREERGQRRKLPDCLMLLVRTHQRGEGRWSGNGFQFPIFPILPLNRFHWGPWTIFLVLCAEHRHLTINTVHIPESETACLGSSPASAPERWISYLTS